MYLKSAVILTALVLIALPVGAGPIWIQEVVYDATGPDSSGSFTELGGHPGTSLEGWSLLGVNGSNGLPYRTVDLSGGVIPEDGVFVVATASANAELAAVRDFIGSVDWQNGPDAVQLWFWLDELVDALQYGDAGDGNAGEGEPAEDVAAGFSLTRDPMGTDTDNNAVDFSSATPTPGVIATATRVPEPGSASLLFLGTALLLRRRV